MTNHLLKAAAGVLAVAGMMASCSDDNGAAPVISNDGTKMSLAVKGLSTTEAGQPVLNVYQFDADGLFSNSAIDSYDPSAIALILGSSHSLYCVSGYAPEADEATTESDFALSVITSPEGENSAPLFLSAWTELERGQKNCELTMKRGVTRIDLDARDADMDITDITVEDAPAASYIFVTGATAPATTATTSYTHTFDSAPTSIESGLFMLFESAAEVHINVNGIIDGTPVTVPAVLSSVERNKVYTLRVYDKNATVKASFSVADWEDGDIIPGGLDTTTGLHIDEATSVIPEGVTVDYLTNVVNVPASGVDGLKISVSSELRVDLDSIAFIGKRVLADSVEAKFVKVVAEKAYNTPTGVISTFTLDIAEQLKGRPDYEIRLYLKKSSMMTSYDYVSVRVAQSPFQIETVKLAGITWMAFNCTTPNLDDQIYVDEGATVEDMYVKDWVTCVGGLFQFGRQYKYVPYQGYKPSNDLGGQKQDIPWIHDTHMPCPEGFRVPTLEELQTIFPHNTPIPGTYTAGNGEQIRVELVRLPGDVVTPTNVNGVCRYLKFISEETGNTLILPLAGYKSDKSTAASANFGRDGVYWSNSNASCPGGYARAYRFMFNWGDNCQMQDFQFQMEAFAYVRAVKID